jgi:hypothetical protein
MKITAAAFALALALLAPAHAETSNSLRDLRDFCLSADIDKQTYCLAYVRGVADGLWLWQITAPKNALVCLSDNGPL